MSADDRNGTSLAAAPTSPSNFGRIDTIGRFWKRGRATTEAGCHPSLDRRRTDSSALVFLSLWVTLELTFIKRDVPSMTSKLVGQRVLKEFMGKHFKTDERMPQFTP